MANMFKDADRFKKYQAKLGVDYELGEDGQPIFAKRRDRELYEEYKDLLLGHNTKTLKLELSFPFSMDTIERLRFRRKYVYLLKDLHEINIKNRFGENNPNFDLGKLVGFGPRLTPNKLPDFQNLKQLNSNVFPFDNNLRNQLLATPKQLVTEPVVTVDPTTGDISKTYFLVGRVGNTNVLFRAVETRTNDPDNRASCIKFAAVCRGEKRGYFDLIRADYKALGNHPNKYNDDGSINLTDGKPDVANNKNLNPRTHIHLSTQEHDIIFPQSTSPDIIDYKDKSGKEFTSYDDMINDFKEKFNIKDQVPILTNAEMQQFGDMSLRDIYRNYSYAEQHFAQTQTTTQTTTQSTAQNTPVINNQPQEVTVNEPKEVAPQEQNEVEPEMCAVNQNPIKIDNQDQDMDGK